MTKHESVQELFSRTAERFAGNIAIDCEGTCVKYSEVEERANDLAGELTHSGVPAGTLIGIVSSNSISVITAIIGILKANCVFVPLDPGFPQNRLEAMITEVMPALFVIESEAHIRIDNLLARISPQSREITIDRGRLCDDSSGKVAPKRYSHLFDAGRGRANTKPDGMCSVYFTSGSTGRPKGIAGRLKGIDHYVRWEIEAARVGEGTRVSQLTSPSFDGFLKDVFVPLCAGGTVCVPESRETILDAKRLIEWIDRQRINVLHCVPSLFRSIVNQELEPGRLQTLKYILLAGEPLLPSDVKRWMDVYEDRVQIVNLYGPTETTIVKLFYFVQPSDKDRRIIPIGKPMGGAAALVLDPKGKVCPSGTVGEIYIRTPFRSLGYYNRPELTKEVFIQNPFTDDPTEIVYKTGDYGRILDDANIEFLGRKDHQVKIRGVRIELGEIENLLRRHDSIQDVAVIDRQDSNGSNYLCAYVVLTKETAASELRQYLLSFLPDFMMPSAFEVMEALPRTFNGKLDRRALPQPGQQREKQEEISQAARNPIEDILSSIWSQVLGVPSVGLHDNFFELGGHSLLAAQMITRACEAFLVQVPLRAIFESPTIASLAKYIEQLCATSKGLQVPPIKAIEREAELPLSFAQQRLWFLSQLDPNIASYNIPAAFRLNGPLDISALEKSLREVINRHEVLRTRFLTVEGRPKQIIAPLGFSHLPIMSLLSLPEAEQEAQAQRLIEEEANNPFDLARDSLIRARLLALSDQEHILLLTMHHIVSDAQSMQLLVGELAILYEAFATGKPSPLAPLPIQYVDFAAWQREWLQDEVLELHLSYWREQLAGASGILELQTDRPRPSAESFRGARERFELPAHLADQIEALSHSEGVTPFLVIAAALNALLNRYSKQDDIVLGCNVASRSKEEIQQLIGFFVNLLPLRSNLSGDPGFRELLLQVREKALQAYTYQDLPFDMIVANLILNRDTTRTPLVQVVLDFQHVRSSIPTVPGLAIEFLATGYTSSKFDLMLHVEKSDRSISGEWIYSTDLFKSSTIARMSKLFEILLSEAAVRPELKLSELNAILDRAEREHTAEEQQAFGEVQRKIFRSIRPKPFKTERLKGETGL